MGYNSPPFLVAERRDAKSSCRAHVETALLMLGRIIGQLKTPNPKKQGLIEGRA